MSRKRLYGKAVAIQISGADAILGPDIPAAMDKAQDLLSRHFADTIRSLHGIGVTLDPDTYTCSVDENDDQIVLSWTCQGHQKRNVIRRLLWAVRL